MLDGGQSPNQPKLDQASVWNEMNAVFQTRWSVFGCEGSNAQELIGLGRRECGCGRMGVMNHDAVDSVRAFIRFYSIWMFSMLGDLIC